jgi:hypothetical protein
MAITDTGLELTRLYTGDDGESHLERVTYGMKPAPNGLVSDPVPVTGLTLRIWNGHPPVHDYHNTTRRQLVIHLAGHVEVETSDGARQELGVGSILVSENLAPGMGHKSHELAQPRLQLLIPLEQGFLDVQGVEQIQAPASDGGGEDR